VRIVLTSLDYPPQATEGVARQRQVLAQGLVRLGHDVHVVTLGTRRESVQQDGVSVHRLLRGDTANEFLPALPVLNRPFTDAQVLCEGVLALADRMTIDVVDVPLWLAQPLALVRHAPCPVVIWLQTTLLQLIELQQREVRAHERVLADVDRFGLSRAAGCIADSASVLAEVERLYGLPSLAARTTVVHPGLSDSPLPPATSIVPRTNGIEALVVGRLEQRKGTTRLFEILPRLLRAVPDLQVRFVGRDNSASDGFQRETGRTYPEAFAREYPDLVGRVHFDGYVDESTLATRYASADLLLHPALYESFGLIFLEAMRASLPTVAFRTGGAIEVFADGEGDGGLLCEAGDFEGLADTVSALARDAGRRRVLGQAAREAFARRFSSERMARETAAAYARVISRQSASSVVRAPARARLFHVMEALQDRDAVSRIARTNAAIWSDLGGERPIMALFSEASVRAETGRIRGARFRREDAAVFHYWGFSRLEQVIAGFPGRKAIHYHNITPPRFFGPRTAHYEMTWRGYRQLDRLADAFDLVIGDSNYNLTAFARHLSSPKPMLCLYPIVDADALGAAEWDRAYAERIRATADGPIWLFVGRFAPNKRQDQVMRAFDRYVASSGGGRLLLVGDMTSVPAYVAQLEHLRGTLANGPRIELVPSVPDSTLRACYRAADLFVCASEHEGFCVPLAEAMAFDVPTLALNRGAVGETIDGSGVLVSDWEPDHVAALAAEVLDTPVRRRAIVEAQRDRLRAFSRAAIQERLGAVAHFLGKGFDSPLFVSSQALPTGGGEEGYEWSTSMN
jgi:glycosyltransferase involved in cell wall biosynthesis